jgi:hypothetical protein
VHHKYHFWCGKEWYPNKKIATANPALWLNSDYFLERNSELRLAMSRESKPGHI